MENNNFYNNFMARVQSPVLADSPREPRKKAWRIVGGAIAGLLVMILIIVGIVAITTQNDDAISDEEDVMNDEVSDALPDDSADIGSAINYDDETGEIASVRMGCFSNEKRYDFYKDNTYEISPLHVIEADEAGTYMIENGVMIIKPKNGSDRAIDLSNLNQLVDGTKVLECEQYDNV